MEEAPVALAGDSWHVCICILALLLADFKHLASFYNSFAFLV